MATRTAPTLRLAVAQPRRRIATAVAWLGRDLALGLVLLAGATVAATLLMLLAVIAAPLAAGFGLWLIWRSGDAAGREARRVRARLRRRARALGLVVLAGSRPALLRLAVGARQAPAPRATR